MSLLKSEEVVKLRMGFKFFGEDLPLLAKEVRLIASKLSSLSSKVKGVVFSLFMFIGFG